VLTNSILVKRMEGFKIIEKKIEDKLRRDVKTMGGIALKLTSPGMAGVPDRLVLIPKGRIYFVELKAPGRSLRPIQLKVKRQLESLGFKVCVIDSYEGVEMFLQEVMG
jgi:hypothetical protein